MPWFGWFLIGFAAGFAGGWAFFKHRLFLKEEALNELRKIRNSVTPR